VLEHGFKSIPGVTPALTPPIQTFEHKSPADMEKLGKTFEIASNSIVIPVAT
jgi:hypothetical protein